MLLEFFLFLFLIFFYLLSKNSTYLLISLVFVFTAIVLAVVFMLVRTILLYQLLRQLRTDGKSTFAKMTKYYLVERYKRPNIYYVYLYFTFSENDGYRITIKDKCFVEIPDTQIDNITNILDTYPNLHIVFINRNKYGVL